MSFTNARLVKEKVGTGGKSTLTGLWLRYLAFSVVVNELSSSRVEMILCIINPRHEHVMGVEHAIKVN